MSDLHIRNATIDDVEIILSFIKGLAEYEKLSNQAVLTAPDLRDTLFGDTAYAEVLIAESDGVPAGFALYFYNYSTFLARPGIYLEDLFVLPGKRGRGIGTALLKRLAQICVENDYGRLEWCVLDWNVDAINVYDRVGATQMNEWITYRLTGEKLINFSDTDKS